MWGWDRYIAHEDLFDLNKPYLVNDSLTVQVEIHCLAASKTVEDVRFPPTDDVAERDFRNMWERKEFSDFTLVSSDGKEFPTHRFILAARCDFFHAMLSHNFKEGTTGRCEIDDMDGETLEAVLEYMYCNEVVSFKRIADKLLAAADKYRLVGLMKICENYLITTVNGESAARLMILADMHSTTALKNTVVKYIKQNYDNFVEFGGLREVTKYKKDLVQELLAKAGFVEDSRDADINESFFGVAG